MQRRKLTEWLHAPRRGRGKQDTPPPAALGMFKTFPVYSASCTTYAQTFATARHLKAAIHAAGGEA